MARVAVWTIVVPRAGTLLVLRCRQPEQEHGRDAERGGFPGLVDGGAD
jgi:hypothetical protein